MKLRLVSLALALSIVGVFAAPAVDTAVAAPAAAPATAPVTGTPAGGGSFVGNFTLQRFAVQGGQLVAIGQLTGTLTDAAGTSRAVNQQVTLPVTNISGTCKILHLELGPLDLNLLGLMVHLDKVVLDITAQRGGGLLGDLLCAIAGVLDSNAPLRVVANLLNRLLGVLGSI